MSLAHQTGDRYGLINDYLVLGQAAACLGEPAKAKSLLLNSASKQLWRSDSPRSFEKSLVSGPP